MASKLELTVVGVHWASEGYPNTLFRLHALRADPRLNVREINVPFRIPSWTPQGNRLIRFGSAALTFTFAHVRVLLRYLRAPAPRRAYVPYPAPLLLCLLGCLPRRLRPGRLAADVFLSIYDTAVEDRRIMPRGSVLARLLCGMERMAFRQADVLLVDTPQNAQYLRHMFGLPADKVVALPLATDETTFVPVPYVPRSGACRVLFIGTMAPLQGVRVIVEAAQRLREHAEVRFRIIGDGQQRAFLQSTLDAYPDLLDWEREWQPSAVLAREIAQADICLGVFGAGDKAQRVCPYKLYNYLRVGRAVITGKTRWARSAAVGFPEQPFEQVPVADPVALAARIAELAADADRRSRLARAGAVFYETHLSNACSEESLVDLMAGPSTGSLSASRGLA